MIAGKMVGLLSLTTFVSVFSIRECVQLLFGAERAWQLSLCDHSDKPVVRLEDCSFGQLVKQ
jgi:hypothetical protein